MENSGRFLNPRMADHSDGDGDGDDGKIHVHVAVGAPISREAFLHVVKELICYVLFMHHQMPCMYSQLASELELLKDAGTEVGRAQKRQRLREKKKLQKLKSSVDTLITTVELAIMAFYPNMGTVALLLGSNPLRPQEAYEIHVPCGSARDDIEKSGPSQKLNNNLLRKLIQTLIASGARGSSHGPRKLYFLIEALSSGVYSSDLLPKRGFSWKLKKVVPVIIHITANEAGDSTKNLSKAILDTPDDMIWQVAQSLVSCQNFAWSAVVFAIAEASDEESECQDAWRDKWFSFCVFSHRQ